MNIFPEKTLSKTEMDIVAMSFSQPAVKEYLRLLAYHTGAMLVTYIGEKGMTPEDLIFRQRFEQGKLACLESLLSITLPEVKPAEQPSN